MTEEQAWERAAGFSPRFKLRAGRLPSAPQVESRRTSDRNGCSVPPKKVRFAIVAYGPRWPKRPARAAIPPHWSVHQSRWPWRESPEHILTAFRYGDAACRVQAAPGSAPTLPSMIEPLVLVVEDDPGLREVLARGLREESFAVRTAADAPRRCARPTRR